MTLWQIITGNSSLPVQAGTTFWDHLNNQLGGNCPGIVAEVMNNNAVLMVDIRQPEQRAEIEIKPLTAQVKTVLTAEITQTQYEATLQCSP
jgi:hypothetical protein